MFLYYHSRNRPVPNRMMWADAETDRLLEAGRQATNDADREKYFREVQRRMHDEALCCPRRIRGCSWWRRRASRTCAATAL